MTPEQMKSNIRDAINALVRGEAEDQEQANDLFAGVIRAKTAALVNPATAAEETVETDPVVDLTTETEPTE